MFGCFAWVVLVGIVTAIRGAITYILWNVLLIEMLGLSLEPISFSFAWIVALIISLLWD